MRTLAKIHLGLRRRRFFPGEMALASVLLLSFLPQARADQAAPGMAILGISANDCANMNGAPITPNTVVCTAGIQSLESTPWVGSCRQGRDAIGDTIFILQYDTNCKVTFGVTPTSVGTCLNPNYATGYMAGCSTNMTNGTSNFSVTSGMTGTGLGESFRFLDQCQAAIPNNIPTETPDAACTRRAPAAASIENVNGTCCVPLNGGAPGMIQPAPLMGPSPVQ